jgi:hypothetical protein
MSLYISQAEMVRLAASAVDEASEDLCRALDPTSVELLSGTSVRASDILSIYKVRLSRWRQEGIPSAVGLEAFVAAVEQQGGSEVVLVGHRNSTKDFVVLMRHNLSEILRTVVIDREDTREALTW